jgi:hypothetical protein
MPRILTTFFKEASPCCVLMMITLLSGVAACGALQLGQTCFETSVVVGGADVEAEVCVDASASELQEHVVAGLEILPPSIEATLPAPPGALAVPVDVALTEGSGDATVPEQGPWPLGHEPWSPD